MNAYCSQCNRPCEVVEVDKGIGPYEYGGVSGFDVLMVTVSECCEAEVRDGPEPSNEDYP